ncbi:MAG: Sulfonate transport system ATP-binding protein [Hyphomicrobiales bacterium]|jgi:sulfonate transport system ATP-binding protein|nr:Sulfonate transport system ATP-binding protein [Hyphomicrobiales bacterium]
MLKIDQICKTYPNGTHALERIELDVAAGEIVALVGGSGCGKTTLLRMITGLEHPTRGAVSLDGDVIAAPHPAVGIVFQEARLLPWLTVSENIAFGLDHLPKAQRDQRVDEALLRVGLSGYGARWPRELSGGQAQRVAIVRALVAQPKALLLDEPFSALDALTRASLQDHLLGLWDAHRPTMVLVTHDVEEAVLLADRAIVLQPRPGRIFADIPIELPRPRDRLSPEFAEAKRVVMNALDGSLSQPSPARSGKATQPAAGGSF